MGIVNVGGITPDALDLWRVRGLQMPRRCTAASVNQCIHFQGRLKASAVVRGTGN